MMKNWRVRPATEVHGRVRVPGDKSISHRSVMLGGIAEGRTEVTGFLAGADCLATLEAFRAMGVRVDRHDETSLTVHGRGLHGLAAPARVLAARINGLFPWPACAVEINGQSIKLGLADVAAGFAAAGVPGEVRGADAEGLLVATGDGMLRLRKLQRPGGRMLAAGEFLRGFPIQSGTRIASRPMPALVSLR